MTEEEAIRELESKYPNKEIEAKDLRSGEKANLRNTCMSHGKKKGMNLE